MIRRGWLIALLAGASLAPATWAGIFADVLFTSPCYQYLGVLGRAQAGGPVMRGCPAVMTRYEFAVATVLGWDGLLKLPAPTDSADVRRIEAANDACRRLVEQFDRELRALGADPVRMLVCLDQERLRLGLSPRYMATGQVTQRGGQAYAGTFWVDEGAVRRPGGAAGGDRPECRRWLQGIA